jgi:hypothetical protein
MGAGEVEIDPTKTKPERNGTSREALPLDTKPNPDLKNRTMKKRNITLFTALAGLALTAPTWAATITWDAGGAADQKWSTAANWTGDALPGAGDTAEIAGGFSAVLDSSVAGITWLEVDGGATLTVKTGADLVMSGEFWVGRNSAATVLHEAGSITTGGGTNGGGDTYVNNGGKYTIEGGILTIGGDPQFGADGAGGTLKIIGDAATINVNDDFKMWTAGSQDGALELVLKGGGISTINVTDYMQLEGTLDVSLDPSFVLPTTNTDYDLLVSAKPDRRGTFDTVTLPNETDWSLTYVDGEAGKDIVRLTYVPVPESSSFAITEIDYDPDADPPTVTLTWRSRPNTTYGAFSSFDLSDWSNELADSLGINEDENPDDGNHITVTFPLSDGLEDATDLFLRIQEE